MRERPLILGRLSERMDGGLVRLGYQYSPPLGPFRQSYRVLARTIQCCETPRKGRSKPISECHDQVSSVCLDHTKVCPHFSSRLVHRASPYLAVGATIQRRPVFWSLRGGVEGFEVGPSVWVAWCVAGCTSRVTTLCNCLSRIKSKSTRWTKWPTIAA